MSVNGSRLNSIAGLCLLANILSYIFPILLGLPSRPCRFILLCPSQAHCHILPGLSLGNLWKSTEQQSHCYGPSRLTRVHCPILEPVDCSSPLPPFSLKVACSSNCIHSQGQVILNTFKEQCGTFNPGRQASIIGLSPSYPFLTIISDPLQCLLNHTTTASSYASHLDVTTSCSVKPSLKVTGSLLPSGR